jgi:hypothetical protein
MLCALARLAAITTAGDAMPTWRRPGREGVRKEVLDRVLNPCYSVKPIARS